MKLSRVPTEAADKDSSAGGFLGSFLSIQKGTRKDQDKATTLYPATDPDPPAGGQDDTADSRMTRGGFTC